MVAMKEVLKRIVGTILAFEARILLARKKPKIIGVTGNVGKTSTKDAIYSVVRSRVQARKSEKSFNSDIGVPLTILGLTNAWGSPVGWFINIVEGLFIALFSREYPEWLVLEMGVDRPGDMKSLASIARPDIVVLTRFPDVPVHVEYFKTSEAVIAEKMELVRALKQEGIIIFNNDDENIRNALNNDAHQKIGFGRLTKSPYMTLGENVVYENSLPVGYEFTITHGAERANIKITDSLGLHYAYSATAAVAVGGILGISLSDGAKALAGHATPPGRMRLIKGVHGTTIIDDTYNSSPLAVEQAIETLSSIHGAKRKIAVLGDMLELGRFSVKEHEKVGRLVATKVDALMTVGVRARSIAESARDGGLKDTRIIEHGDASAAAKDLVALIKPGDVILIKGSQGVRMEKIVKAVMENPSDAQNLLVRQDQMWQTK